MENPNKSYKSKIKDYVCSLDIEATKKKQIYIALNGGIYSSLKEKKGKGTRTMYFEDGTKQNVNTYEGRFKAVSKILGNDLDNSKELYGLIVTGDYGTKSRNNYFKKTAAKNYLEVKEIKESRKKNLEGEVLVGSAKALIKDGKVILGKSAYALNSSQTKPVENFGDQGNLQVDQTYSDPVSIGTIQNTPLPKKRSFLKRVAIAAGMVAIGSALFFGNSCGDSKKESNENHSSKQEIVQTLVKSDKVQETSLENKVFAEVSTLEKTKETNEKRNYYEGLVQSEIEFSYKLNEFYGSENENEISNEESCSNLEKLLEEEMPSTSEEISPEYERHLQDYVSENASEAINNQTQEIQPTSTNQNSSQKYCVIKDLQKYVDHTTARNAQIRDGELSINPLHLVKQTGNNFVPLAEELTDFSSLGYSNEDFSNRTKGVKSGFKKIGNGLQKLVSLGFWDSRKEEEKTNEGNQALRFLKSPYDVVVGAVQTVVNSADYITAGVLGKTLNTTIDATRGVVGTAVSATNYLGAVPFYPIDKSEELLHENTCSQKVYETVFSLARFGGNVLSHEVPERGKTVEIISNDGKKVVLDKGEIGATLELLTGLGLDSFAISKLVDGSGSSHSSGNGGGIPSNGGVVIIPGNGGSVGGGM